MRCQLSDFLLLRIPLNSTENYQIDNIREILTGQLFLSALYLATPDFFSNLEKKKLNLIILRNTRRPPFVNIITAAVSVPRHLVCFRPCHLFE
jgi:hypothetical protein